MPLADFLLPEFDQEMAGTRNVLERVPQDKLDWRACEKCNTIGWNAKHLAEIPGWVKVTLELPALDLNPPGGPPYERSKASTAAEFVALFDKNVAAGHALIAAATDEKLAEPWSLQSGGQTIFTMPRYNVLRSMIFNHTVHHRAFLCSYLRQIGVPVPGLYGPSGDEG